MDWGKLSGKEFGIPAFTTSDSRNSNQIRKHGCHGSRKYTFMQSNLIDVKICPFYQERCVLEIKPSSRQRANRQTPRRRPGPLRARPAPCQAVTSRLSICLPHPDRLPCDGRGRGRLCRTVSCASPCRRERQAGRSPNRWAEEKPSLS